MVKSTKAEIGTANIRPVCNLTIHASAPFFSVFLEQLGKGQSPVITTWWDHAATLTPASTGWHWFWCRRHPPVLSRLIDCLCGTQTQSDFRHSTSSAMPAPQPQRHILYVTFVMWKAEGEMDSGPLSFCARNVPCRDTQSTPPPIEA